MDEYQVYGPDKEGVSQVLGTRRGELPDIGDIIEIGGGERKVKSYTTVHREADKIARVVVGRIDDGRPVSSLV